MNKIIDTEKLEFLKDWFINYTRSFDTQDFSKKTCLTLKEKHTLRVCATIKSIASSIELSQDDVNLAETIGLLHDIGRFEQFNRYRTFSDARSVNHAELGVQVLRKTDILDDICSELKELIIFAVSNHNRLELEKSDSDKYILFANMIRDADKIDIYEFFTGSIYGKELPPGHPVALELPDLPLMTDEILESLIDKRVSNMKHLKYLNDLKLNQLSWIYDFNFPISFQIIKENKYIEKIFATLPQTEKISQISSMLSDLIDNKISQQ